MILSYDSTAIDFFDDWVDHFVIGIVIIDRFDVIMVEDQQNLSIRKYSDISLPQPSQLIV